MKRLVFLLALVIAATATLVVSVPLEAEACGNKMYRFKKDPRNFVLTKAKWLLANDRPKEVFRPLLGQWPMDELSYDVERIEDGKAERPGRRRALHMLAAAVVRTEGRYSISMSSKEVSAEAAEENLRWALTVLDSIAKSVDEAGAYRAEARHLLGERPGAVLVELETLAQADKLPDAHAWRLLAEIHRHNNNIDEAIDADGKALIIAAASRETTEPHNEELRSRSRGRKAALVLWD